VKEEQSLRTKYTCSYPLFSNTPEVRKTKKEYWNLGGIEEGAKAV